MERHPLKCPKCDLVTFDHLPQCPSCNASFRLNRALTRRRRDSNRPIYIPAARPPEPEDVVELAEPPVDGMRLAPEAPIPPTARVTAPAVGAATLPTPDAPGLTPEPRSATASRTAPEPKLQSEPEPEPELELQPELQPEPEPELRSELQPEPEPELRLELDPKPELAETTLPEVAAPPVTTATPDNDAISKRHPSLGQLAAAERRQALIASSSGRAEASRPTPSSPAEDASSNADAHASDAQALKQRMMRASRARRKRRPDLIAETIDPVLPGWYEPGIESSVAEPVTTGSSSD